MTKGAIHGKRNHHHRQARRLDVHGRLRQAAGDSENKKGGPRRDSGPHGHRRSAGIRGPGHPGGVLAEDGQKEYIAGLRLGRTTDTQDTSGETLDTHPVLTGREDLLHLLPRFTGEIQQVPPMLFRR